MKRMFPKYVAALLAVWYSLSIIGFDVHSCATTGDTFVNSILGGITCEDIHPEHDCNGHGSCCSQHKCCGNKQHAPSCSHDDKGASVGHSDKGCCTDDIEVLDSESVTVQNDDCSQVAQPVFIRLGCDISPLLCTEMSNVEYYPDPGNRVKPDSQARLNIWRI